MEKNKVFHYYVTIIGETMSGDQWYHFEYESTREFKVGDLIYSDEYKSKDFGNRDFIVKFIKDVNGKCNLSVM